jgi:hypothetical protein
MTALLESPGTIAVPTSEIGRFALFTSSLAGTWRPDGTQISMMASASVTQNLNQIISDMDDEKRWCWIVGDDHAWENDCLTRMLAVMDATPEADILVPLVTKRNPPWHLVAFRSAGTHEDGMPAWKPVEWEDVPDEGTFEIDAAGSAGMLIRRELLDMIGDPWFESSAGVILNEDVYFCRKATDRGARIFATADVTMAHIGVFNVRPFRREERWGAMTEFSTTEMHLRHVFIPDIPEHDVVVHGR